jgi:hypothetical protein
MLAERRDLTRGGAGRRVTSELFTGGTDGADARFPNLPGIVTDFLVEQHASQAAEKGMIWIERKGKTCLRAEGFCWV